MQVLTKDPSVHWSSRQQKIVSDRPLAEVKRLGFQKTRWDWFPWCSESLSKLVHPFDLSVAARFVPGPRILTVNQCPNDEQFLLAHYGHLSFRIKPNLWREVEFPGAELGELVEISRLYSPREPRMAIVEEIFWDTKEEGIRFQLSTRGKLLPELYSISQFLLVGQRAMLPSAS